MSTLRVAKITNRTETGPIEFTKGVVLPANQAILDENGNNAIKISSVGVVTANSFSGDGSGISLTGSGVSKGTALGLLYLS